MPFTDADVPDQSGRCIIVTGANTGIGFAAALVLAARRARNISHFGRSSRPHDIRTRTTP